jgi:hypothetical protein
MDAVERAGTDVLQSTSNCTQDFVTHRYEFPFSSVTRTPHFALCSMKKKKKKGYMDMSVHHLLPMPMWTIFVACDMPSAVAVTLATSPL